MFFPGQPINQKMAAVSLNYISVVFRRQNKMLQSNICSFLLEFQLYCRRVFPPLNFCRNRTFVQDNFINIFFRENHCGKNVQIQSFFWSAFSRIQSECGKIRTRKNSVFGHFSRSECIKILVFITCAISSGTSIFCWS